MKRIIILLCFLGCANLHAQNLNDPTQRGDLLNESRLLIKKGMALDKSDWRRAHPKELSRGEEILNQVRANMESLKPYYPDQTAADDVARIWGIIKDGRSNAYDIPSVGDATTYGKDMFDSVEGSFLKLHTKGQKATFENWLEADSPDLPPKAVGYREPASVSPTSNQIDPIEQFNQEMSSAEFAGYVHMGASALLAADSMGIIKMSEEKRKYANAAAGLASAAMLYFSGQAGQASMAAFQSVYSLFKKSKPQRPNPVYQRLFAKLEAIDNRLQSVQSSTYWNHHDLSNRIVRIGRTATDIDWRITRDGVDSLAGCNGYQFTLDKFRNCSIAAAELFKNTSRGNSLQTTALLTLDMSSDVARASADVRDEYVSLTALENVLNDQNNDNDTVWNFSITDVFVAPEISQSEVSSQINVSLTLPNDWRNIVPFYRPNETRLINPGIVSATNDLVGLSISCVKHQSECKEEDRQRLKIALYHAAMFNAVLVAQQNQLVGHGYFEVFKQILTQGPTAENNTLPYWLVMRLLSENPLMLNNYMIYSAHTSGTDIESHYLAWNTGDFLKHMGKGVTGNDVKLFTPCITKVGTNSRSHSGILDNQRDKLGVQPNVTPDLTNSLELINSGVDAPGANRLEANWGLCSIPRASGARAITANYFKTTVGYYASDAMNKAVLTYYSL